MPLVPARLSGLRKLKGLKQGDLARAAEVTQTHISECESGKEPSVQLLEKLADALDCTTDFLLGRSFPAADEDDATFRNAASRMAFEVFEGRDVELALKEKHRLHCDQCQRILGHHAAPVTANRWQILAEQIDLAIGPGTNGDLRVIRGGASA